MTAIALNHRLTHAVRQGTLDDLIAAWRMDEISVLLPGMGGFAASPSLGNKLRGAMGAVLLQSASGAVLARRPCDWSRTSTAEIFYGSRPLIRLGDHDSEIAKPFVLEAVAESNGTLKVILKIFGTACERTAAIADALVSCLCHDVNWSDMAKDGPRFIPTRIDPAEVKVATINAVEPIKAPSEVELTFFTSFDADRGDPVASPTIVLERIIRRAALVAPWHGVSISAIFNDLAKAARAVTIDGFELTSAMAPEIGGHHMINQLAPPMTISLSGPLHAVWPAIRLGEIAHVGRGASLGLGRYRIAIR